MPNVMATLPNIGGALCSNAAKYGWRPILECRAVTLQRCVEIRWDAQATRSISAASESKFTILWGHMEEILLLNKFFRYSIRA